MASSLPGVKSSAVRPSSRISPCPSAVDATTARYRVAEQPSLDGNSVDLDRERADFADNALRYEAALRFVNGSVRTMLSAIRGE